MSAVRTDFESVLERFLFDTGENMRGTFDDRFRQASSAISGCSQHHALHQELAAIKKVFLSDFFSTRAKICEGHLTIVLMSFWDYVMITLGHVGVMLRSF